MMRTPVAAIVVASALSLFTITAAAQHDSKADEQAIRKLSMNLGLTMSKTTQSPEDSLYAPNAIFWSGAMERPFVGDLKELAHSPATKATSERVNEKWGPPTIDRVVASGDLAYEYGHVPADWTEASDKKHVHFVATYLRVWQRQQGRWKIAAEFIRPDPSNISD